MSDALALMRAILGTDDAAAAAALDAALLAETDPLRWCALNAGLSEADVMRRAALWADLAFFERVPRLAHAPVQLRRPERLASVRLVRLHLLDREVAFAAPDFFGLLRLARRRRQNPSLRLRLCLVPDRALRRFITQAASAALIDDARQNLARKWPYAAAQLDLPSSLRWSFVAAILLLVGLLLAAPYLGQAWLLPIWASIISLPTFLRMAALFQPLPSDPPLHLTDPAELPLYSVLVPLRDEANMVNQLCTTLSELNYPADRLEVLFVVERRSAATLAAVERRLGDIRFSLIDVPDALPRTKPKALDFALPLCRGEFVVVYDAEDRPEPDQLLRVLSHFRARPDLECVQARLQIDNAGHGFLPSQFAGEYAGLFAVLLPALAQWELVMPLGGTSNHFRAATLRRLGGWDAFNVTEDADVGVRLARRGLRTATCASVTLEAAPTSYRAWLGQRTRWMKGWMQTFLVHNRRPAHLLADLGWPGFVIFQVLVLGMIVSALMHAAFGIGLALSLLRADLALVLPPWGTAIYMAVLLLGQGTAIATNLVGLMRTGRGHLWWTQLALPFYWVLIGLATLRALFELALRPFHWFKTPHLAGVPAPAGRRFVQPARRAQRAISAFRSVGEMG